MLASLFAAPLSLRTNAADLRERWIYSSTNLMVDKNIDSLEALFRRAAKAGYNGVLLADSKFGRLGQMPPHYFQNVERVKATARESALQIVPAVFPLGYSEALLVRDACFVVRNHEARVVTDPPVALKGADFKTLAGWAFHDPCVTADRNAARATDPKGHNARIEQNVRLQPFRQYHIAVEIKTQAFAGTPEVKVLGKSQGVLNYAYLGVKKTQDWTLHHVVFNSLDNTDVGIYFGCWDGTTGSLWWRNPRLEEAGLLNVVRRGGAPLEVKTEAGQLLVEGRDYEKVSDPRMGVIPWKGCYEVWHEPPPIRTPLPDGTRLRVSFYHAITVHDGQVMICPSEPETVALLRDQARRMHAAWHAKAYFMSHDEIRVLGWDKACEERHMDSGAILADNVRTCIGILREVDPRGDIYVWGDMFDPNHNARENYYLVRGDLRGSWKGLDDRVIVVPWAIEKRTESLKWFAGLGNRMLIAGYYDSPPERVRDWLDAAARVDGVIGIMYTTWRQQYGDLEKFSAAIRATPVEK